MDRSIAEFPLDSISDRLVSSADDWTLAVSPWSYMWSIPSTSSYILEGDYVVLPCKVKST